jgi:hypothetical protein
MWVSFNTLNRAKRILGLLAVRAYVTHLKQYAMIQVGRQRPRPPLRSRYYARNPTCCR